MLNQDYHPNLGSVLTATRIISCNLVFLEINQVTHLFSHNLVFLSTHEPADLFLIGKSYSKQNSWLWSVLVRLRLNCVVIEEWERRGRFKTKFGNLQEALFCSHPFCIHHCSSQSLLPSCVVLYTVQTLPSLLSSPPPLFTPGAATVM